MKHGYITVKDSEGNLRKLLVDGPWARRCKISKPGPTRYEAKVRESMRQRSPMYDNMKARR